MALEDSFHRFFKVKFEQHAAFLSFGMIQKTLPKAYRGTRMRNVDASV